LFLKGRERRMRDDIKKALIRVENKHYAAVQCDTELGHFDYNDAKWISIERKSKQFWDECKKARAELEALLDKISEEELKA
jgi:hypothetical protein